MKQYFQLTRSPWHAYLFALPLLVLYQVVTLLANIGQRERVVNGADAILQNLLALVGVHGWVGSWCFVALLVGIILYHRDPLRKQAAPRAQYLLAVLVESSAYALVLGSVVSYLTSLVLPFGGFLQIGGGGLHFGQKLATSLGAGLYEELVFRVLLTGGAIWALTRMRLRPGAAAALAVVGSSFIFSLFHYVGPFGETFGLTSFTFRFIAGAVLAALYASRGFAVAAWTHALYDVFLLLVGRA